MKEIQKHRLGSNTAQLQHDYCMKFVVGGLSVITVRSDPRLRRVNRNNFNTNNTLGVAL